MNNIKFNQTGGFPLDTDVLNAMQTAYHLFNGLGHLAGDFAIISGCEEQGSNVGDGIVFIKGEVLPFKGGAKGDTVIIKEETESRIFEDGNTKPVILRREAIFGTSTPENSFQWGKFVRTKSLLELEAEKATTKALEKLEKDLKKKIDDHLLDKENPHKVSREQLGILRVGSVYIGNIVKGTGTRYENQNYIVTSLENLISDERARITFKTPLKTSNYIVLGTFNSVYSNWDENNDLGFIVLNKTTNSFDLAMREYASGAQDVNFDFVIMSLN